MTSHAIAGLTCPYHKILLSPHDWQPIHRAPLLAREEAFTPSDELAPVLTELLQYSARFLFLCWTEAERDAVANSCLDV